MGIMTRTEPQAPGCFGFAITFDPRATRCNECEYAAGCQSQAYASLESASKSSIDVSDLSRLHTSFGKPVITTGDDLRLGASLAKSSALTAQQKDAIEALGGRAASIARTIFRTVPDPLASLRKGVNPFIGIRPFYLETFAHELLAGGVQRPRMKAIYLQQNPSWTERTAETRCSTVAALFLRLGFITDDAGTLRIKK